MRRKEMSEVLDKVKIWLKNEVKANDKYEDDPTDTAECLLMKIKDWEKGKTNA
jgi:hypothetical protein